jgi:DNA-binding transcriptional ArsR family regulator
MALPEEIEDSLEQYGGISGLMKTLPTDEELAGKSAVYRACADETRLKILSMLAIQPLCVCVIKTVCAIADSKLSYHLNVLKKAGLIEGRQQGNWIIYRLTSAGKECIRRL